MICESTKMKLLILGAALISSFVNGASAQSFARAPEGILTGYIVQREDGEEVCRNPLVYRRGNDAYLLILCGIDADGIESVTADTNGMLKGYVVVAPNGAVVCTDPMVWNQFRGEESYIVCE